MNLNLSVTLFTTRINQSLKYETNLHYFIACPDFYHQLRA